VNVPCTFSTTGWSSTGTAVGSVPGSRVVYGDATGISGHQPFNLTYDYDRVGNLTWQGTPTGQTGGGTVAGAYTYPASGATSVRPHARNGP
jgi:hypothetical protein